MVIKSSGNQVFTGFYYTVILIKEIWFLVYMRFIKSDFKVNNNNSDT